jgi:hypothetical protein
LKGEIHDSTTLLASAEPNGPSGNPSPNSFGIGTSPSGTRGKVTVAADVRYGSIELLAQSISANQPQPINNLDSGKVQGSFQDSVTIEAPGLGTARGYLVTEYVVSGSVNVTGATDPNSQTFAEYQYDLLVGEPFGDAHDPRLQGYHRVYADGTPEIQGPIVLNQKGQFKSPAFFSGKPFPVRWFMNAWVRSSQGRPDQFNVQTHATLRIVDVVDEQGKSVPFTMRSQSGTEYGAQKLWIAGRDLANNEKPDRATEANAVNETVPSWSYGYRASAAGTDLTLFTPAQHTNSSGGRAANTSFVNEAVEGWDPDASVLVNTSSGDVVYDYGFGALKPLLPGQMFFHPSAGRAFAVARWTAPAAGRYNIVARWLDLDDHGGDGVSCHFVVNGSAVFNHDLANGGVIDMPSQAIDLEAGHTIDFVVGARGDFTFDATGFNAAISLAPAVAISVSGAENGRVNAGADVSVTADVLFADPAQTVELRDNGRVVGRDDSAPYQFTIENIESGTHSLRVVAIDPRGVEGASGTVEITAVQSGPSSRATARRANDSSRSASAQSGTSYFFLELFGDWDNPFSWTPVGVPGPNDDAFIVGPGNDRGSVVTLRGKVDVRTLNVGAGCKIVVDAGAPRFDRGITGLQGIWLNDCELRGFELVVGRGAQLSSENSPQFFNIAIFNNGEITYHNSGRTVADAASELRNNGSVTLQRNLASNVPAEVTIPQLQHNGGLLAVAPGSKLITGTLQAKAPVKLLSDQGTALIGSDGGSLIGSDGGSLIGSDGGSLIGSDGGSAIGPNGAPLVGSDGATLVGNAGNTLLGPRRQAAEAESQSQATEQHGIVLGAGAVLSGRGNVVGNLVNEAGFVAPGSSADVIRVLGNYTQEQAGTLVLEVGGTTVNPPQFDQLQVRGAANLGGRLIVKTINGFTPQSGDTFSPLTYDSVSGNFSSISSNAQVSLGSGGVTMQVSGPNPPAPKALNISTRMRVETGDNALIAGFIITGATPKKVIVRGLGPSLPVSEALADPLLDLDAGAVRNDDWRSNEQAVAATGIPPQSDLESAIVATLEPGAHTAVLRGKNSGTGVGLVEVYDLESGAPVQLANISTRGQVQTGDNVMIGGFIIGGDYPAKVLLRAIGPSLPVNGALQDPILELVDANGAPISNDNWRATQEAEIAAIIPPSDDREAAIIATLVPGSYTAIVRGKDNTAGVALVEGYNLQ